MARAGSRRSVALVLAGLVLLVVAYRGWQYLNLPAVLRAKREARALVADGPIHLAAVWPRSERTHFFNGVRLAVDESTAAGRPGGRPLVVHELDEASPQRGTQLARTIRRDLEIVAVIGHYWREAALQASITYEEAGIAFLATGTSSARLCSHSFRYVVQPLLDDTRLAQDLAQELVRHDITTLSVLHVRNLYGDKLSSAVIEQALEVGLGVVHSAAYSERRTDFLPIIADLAAAGPEGVVVIDNPTRASRLISQMGTMDLATTVIGGPPLEDPVVAAAVAGSRLQLRVLSTFWTGDTAARVQRFVADYTERFGEQPSWEAALAYEAVQLLVQAIERSGSAAPLSVTTMLKYGGPWQCLMGPCGFDADGRIADRKIYFMTVEDGQFLEDVHVESGLPAAGVARGASRNEP